jgi:hypothetical protein
MTELRAYRDDDRDTVVRLWCYEGHGLSGGATRVNPVNGMAVIEYGWAPGRGRQAP